MKTKHKTKRKQAIKHKNIGRTLLRGVAYSDYQRARGLKLGVPLSVVHEPTNPFDTNALKVLCNGVKIGYLPMNSGIAADVHLRHNQGCKIYAKLVGYHSNNPTWSMLTVEVSHSPVPRREVSCDFDEVPF